MIAKSLTNTPFLQREIGVQDADLEWNMGYAKKVNIK